MVRSYRIAHAFCKALQGKRFHHLIFCLCRAHTVYLIIFVIGLVEDLRGSVCICISTQVCQSEKVPVNIQRMFKNLACRITIFQKRCAASLHLASPGLLYLCRCFTVTAIGVKEHLDRGFHNVEGIDGPNNDYKY